MPTYDRNPYNLPEFLDTNERSLFANIQQTGLPVLQSDLALGDRISIDRMTEMYNALFHSGWFDIPVKTSESYSDYGANVFSIAKLTGMVNGFMFTMDGTGQSTKNRINLTSVTPSHTTDLIFIEFWTEQVDENGVIYRYGNRNYYNPAHFTNDLINDDVGLAGAARIQLRYRIRVVPSATKMSDSTVHVQGKKATPDSTHGFTFDDETHLWVANTNSYADVLDFDDVTGIIYALPICLVTRTINTVSSATITDLRTPICLKEELLCKPSTPLLTEGSRYIRPYFIEENVTSTVLNNTETVIGSITFTDVRPDQLMSIECQMKFDETTGIPINNGHLFLRIRKGDINGKPLNQMNFIENNSGTVPRRTKLLQVLISDSIPDIFGTQTYVITVETNNGALFKNFHPKIIGLQYFTIKQPSLPSSDLWLVRHNIFDVYRIPPTDAGQQFLVPTTDETKIGSVKVVDLTPGQKVLVHGSLVCHYTSGGTTTRSFTGRLREDNEAGTVLDELTFTFTPECLLGFEYGVMYGMWTPPVGVTEKTFCTTVKATEGNHFLTNGAPLITQFFPKDVPAVITRGNRPASTNMYYGNAQVLINTIAGTVIGDDEYFEWERFWQNGTEIEVAHVWLDDIQPGQVIQFRGNLQIRFDDSNFFATPRANMIFYLKEDSLGGRILGQAGVNWRVVAQNEKIMTLQFNGQLGIRRGSGNKMFLLTIGNFYPSTVPNPTITHASFLATQFFYK